MKSIYQNYISRLGVFALCITVMATYSSCQKADPDPVGVILPGAASSASNSTFTASVHGSPTQTFTGSKSSSSGSIILTGTNSFYTITITFPNTAGPGTYFLPLAGFSVTVNDGINTYSTNTSPGGGIFDINSVTNGNYTGDFNITAYDAASAATPANGNFSNL